MKKFIKKIKSNKFLYILSVLIIGVFIILITRVTYAFLAPIINEAQTNVAIKGDTIDEYSLKVGNPLKINATPTTLKENGTNYTTSTTATASLKANSTKNTATYGYYLYFQIENNTFTYTSGTTPEIILTITNPNGEEITSIEGLTYGTFNGVSGFDVTTKNGLFNIANNYQITSNSSTTATIHEWTITLTYLNQSYDQSGNFGKSMEVGVLLQKEKVKPLLADYVKSLYTGTQGENSIYYHTSTLTNGAGDNSYRYAGANPNNYVCFGASASTCPTDNLYRIIGVFGDQVKLIKYDYANSNLLGTDGDNSTFTFSKSDYSTYKGELTTINRYYWNYKNNTSINGGRGSNEWSTSLFNKKNLNTNYLNNIGTTWSNLIEDTTWKVSGHTTSAVTPKAMYTAEITNASKTYGPSNGVSKIGLMYASDYGFAAASSAWTSNMSDYYRSTITFVNWMYMGLYDWTMTPYSMDSTYVFHASDYGDLNNNYAVNGFGARPVLYLKASVTYISGSGSASDPILIN